MRLCYDDLLDDLGKLVEKLGDRALVGRSAPARPPRSPPLPEPNARDEKGHGALLRLHACGCVQRQRCQCCNEETSCEVLHGGSPVGLRQSRTCPIVGNTQTAHRFAAPVTILEKATSVVTIDRRSVPGHQHPSTD